MTTLTLTTDEARAELARGALTLRQVAALWAVPLGGAYARLYDRPMPAPAALPARPPRIYWRPRRRQLRRPR